MALQGGRLLKNRALDLIKVTDWHVERQPGTAAPQVNSLPPGEFVRTVSWPLRDPDKPLCYHPLNRCAPTMYNTSPTVPRLSQLSLLCPINPTHPTLSRVSTRLAPHKSQGYSGTPSPFPPRSLGSARLADISVTSPTGPSDTNPQVWREEEKNEEPCL